MDFFDKLAFLGRRYNKQRVPGTGSTRFSLHDVLSMFNHNTILELTPTINGKALATERPDAERKIKVSLLDKGISAINSHQDDWYEVYRTPPSGDVSKVRIVAFSPTGQRVGEILMLVSERLPIFYFGEDPIIDALAKR